jgi:hypothetical protein
VEMLSQQQPVVVSNSARFAPLRQMTIPIDHASFRMNQILSVDGCQVVSGIESGRVEDLLCYCPLLSCFDVVDNKHSVGGQASRSRTSKT